MISTASIILAYGDIQRFALAVPDMTVRAGEKIGLMGPSGIGKSTLLSALAGLVAPFAGALQVAGIQLDGASTRARRQLRAQQGLILQNPALVPYLDVRENVLLPLRLRGDRIDAGIADRVTELLDRIGLGARADHRPAALSRGECQRVAICRALLPRPALILADEPTAALDVESTRVAMDLIFEWMGTRGTLVMASHDPSLRPRFDRTLDLTGWVA
ncbi:MAG: putative ABC transport system ATP-binding protein [Bradymonadia bacterium]